MSEDREFWRRFGEGFLQGREEEHARWEAWNRRRMAAKAAGRPFNEPTPSEDDASPTASELAASEIAADEPSLLGEVMSIVERYVFIADGYLKRRYREGWIEGFAEGIESRLAEAREESTKRNRRRTESEADGPPFDEPPP